MSESRKVRAAVQASKTAGTLTTALISLITRIVRRRVARQLADDILQTVLLALLRHLPRIDATTSYNYICTTVVRTWQKYMRGRAAAAKGIGGGRYFTAGESRR